MKSLIKCVTYFLISCISIFAQTNPWVEYQLSVPSMQYKAAVGEACIIFIENYGDTIKAFDIFSKQWHEYIVNTDLPWCYNKSAVASGNTALVYNDSIIVTYNAFTHSFAEIHYTGSLLADNPNFYGCKKNMAYFLTDQFLYVFDALTNAWYNFAYVPSSILNSNIGFLEEDYLCFTFAAQGNYQIIAYSNTTHTMQIMNSTEELFLTPLDSGFVWRDGMGLTKKFGLYSSITGNFDNIDLGEIKFLDCYFPNKYPGGGAEPTISSVYCAILCWFEDLGSGIKKCHFYSADTRTGSINYTLYGLNSTSNTLGARYAGGEFCMNEIIEIDSLGHHLDHYLAIYNSEGFHNPLHIPLLSFNDIPPGYLTGGQVLFGLSKSMWMGFNCNTLTYSVKDIPEEFYLSRFASGNNWAAIAGSVNDTLWYVYSYNSNTNQITGPIIRSYKYEAGGFGGINVYVIIVKTSDFAREVLFYSPVLDQWSYYDQGSNSSFIDVNRDYVGIIYPDINQTLIYNGISGDKIWLPFGNIYNYKGNDYSFLTYSNNGYYVAYSAIKNDWTDFTGSTTGLILGNEGITLIYGSPYNYVLVYNAFTNEFIPTDLSPNQGTLLTAITGGKTALVVTFNGYLLALDPQIVSDINEPYSGIEELEIEFLLSQNFPNPFNPSTTISWQAPVGSHQTLKVYDVLGNEIATLVDEFREAGRYEVEFNVAHESIRAMASGIYFYMLQAGSFIETKKMVLIK